MALRRHRPRAEAMRNSCALLYLFALGQASLARADAIGLDPAGLSNFTAILESSVSKSIITTVGILAAPYPYGGATPLGTSVGLDIGISITTLKLPDAFLDSLNLLGANTTSLKNSIIPVPVAQIHKGLGPRLDLGIYYFSFQGYKFYGGDVKIALWVPEEGPGFAFRFGYGVGELGIVSTKTIAPELIFSRKLEFAEPYIGAGAQIISGAISYDGVPGLPINQTGLAARAFLGLSLKLLESGIIASVEGGYNSYGAHALGMKAGVSF